MISLSFSETVSSPSKQSNRCTLKSNHFLSFNPLSQSWGNFWKPNLHPEERYQQQERKYSDWTEENWFRTQKKWFWSFTSAISYLKGPQQQLHFYVTWFEWRRNIFLISIIKNVQWHELMMCSATCERRYWKEGYVSASPASMTNSFIVFWKSLPVLRIKSSDKHIKRCWWLSNNTLIYQTTVVSTVSSKFHYRLFCKCTYTKWKQSDMIDWRKVHDFVEE
jgi:hypothetical protein